MKWFDLLKLSLSNLWRRKLRTLLTLLGVIIGTASIVTMLSIGLGQTKAMMDMIASSSDLTTIKVLGNSGMDMGFTPGANQENQEELKLNQSTLDMFRSLPNVAYVSPVLEINMQLKQGSAENYMTVQGMSQEALVSKNIFITEGSMPNLDQQLDHLPLFVGRDLVNNFYDPNSQDWQPIAVDMVNETVFATIEDGQEKPENYKPKKYPIKADAIMGVPDENSWSDNLYAAYTEIHHLEIFLSNNYRGKAWPGQQASKTGKPVGEIIYPSAIVGSTDIEYTKEILNQIRDMGFMVESNVEYIDSMRDQSMTQQLVLGGIGGISLFVAAIGIANTMMMSVYERTREIGIFKVLGCSLRNIRNIFLTEAALIGLLGGIIGIGLSFAISAILNSISGAMGMSMGEGVSISVIPLWLIAGAIFFAMFIGILAGVLPARRAMKLSALEAIRNN